MFSFASTYCAETGRSKIPADDATASATIGDASIRRPVEKIVLQF
jgi:hypothetical protein